MNLINTTTLSSVQPFNKLTSHLTCSRAIHHLPRFLCTAISSFGVNKLCSWFIPNSYSRDLATHADSYCGIYTNSLETFVVVRPLFSNTFTKTCHKSSLIIFDWHNLSAKPCLCWNSIRFGFNFKVVLVTFLLSINYFQ